MNFRTPLHFTSAGTLAWDWSSSLRGGKQFGRFKLTQTAIHSNGMARGVSSWSGFPLSFTRSIYRAPSGFLRLHTPVESPVIGCDDSESKSPNLRCSGSISLERGGYFPNSLPSPPWSSDERPCWSALPPTGWPSGVSLSTSCGRSCATCEAIWLRSMPVCAAICWS